MPITLYHDVPSTNSDRVKIALAEKGLRGAAELSSQIGSDRVVPPR